MKKLTNGMHFKIFQKRVSSVGDLVKEFSLMESLAGSVPHVQFQQVRVSSGDRKYDVTVVSNQGLGCDVLNPSCPFQMYMKNFGFRDGWSVISEKSDYYCEIERHLLAPFSK